MPIKKGSIKKAVKKTVRRVKELKKSLGVKEGKRIPAKALNKAAKKQGRIGRTAKAFKAIKAIKKRG